MIFFAASIVVQVLCVIHILNTDRDRIWIWIVLLLSALGCCAYFSFQVMPELFGPGSRHARRTFSKVEGDPVRKLKAAEEKLRLVDTAANRTELGDVYFSMKAFGEAATEYRKALDHLKGRDTRIETKLAWTLFQGGRFAEALAAVENIARPNSIGEADRLDFLRARILVELGRKEEARSLYSDIVTRLPGEEVRCRYSALLLDMGKSAEAREVLESVEHQLRHAVASQSDEDRAMAEWAVGELQSLRNAAAS